MYIQGKMYKGDKVRVMFSNCFTRRVLFPGLKLACVHWIRPRGFENQPGGKLNDAWSKRRAFRKSKDSMVAPCLSHDIVTSALLHSSMI